MTPASLGLVTFRRHPPGVDDEAELEALNTGIAEAIERQGDVFVSTGRVRGRLVVRLCILNHSTSEREVDRALELAAHANAAPPAERRATRESYPSIEQGWLRRPQLDAEGLRSLALFSSLDDALAARVLGVSHEHHAVPGEGVIEQWQVSRDLYVVLEGTVAVEADGRRLAVLGPGDFFGELAAIEWGAGFARTRAATVTALEPCRMLVLGREIVSALRKRDDAFGEQVERISRERLATL
jgi:hypothetical protein